MAEEVKKKIVRKKIGFKRVVVELTESHYDALAKLAVEDLRNGGATEMATVILRLNLDALIKNHRPAQAPLLIPQMQAPILIPQMQVVHYPQEESGE